MKTTSIIFKGYFINYLDRDLLKPYSTIYINVIQLITYVNVYVGNEDKTNWVGLTKHHV